MSIHLSESKDAYRSRMERRALRIFKEAGRHASFRRKALWQDMLELTSPGLTHAVPPLALAQFASAAESIEVPAGTAFWTSMSTDGRTIEVEFRTLTAYTILPIELADVTYDPLVGRLRLTLRNKSSRAWNEINFSQLTIQCVTSQTGSHQRPMAIADSVLDPTTTASLRLSENNVLPITLLSPSRVNRQLLTPVNAAQSGMTMLQEMLVLPESFASFTLAGFGQLPEQGDDLIVEITAPRLCGLLPSPRLDDFQLHVVPVSSRRPFSTSLHANVTSLFHRIDADRDHQVLSVDSVHMLFPDGEWQALSRMGRLSSRGEKRDATKYAVMRPPLAGAAKSAIGKDEIYLQLIMPKLSPQDSPTQSLHVVGTQCVSASLGKLTDANFKTESPAPVKLIVKPTPLYVPPSESEPILRRILGAGNPLWHKGPDQSAAALRELVHLFGLCEWNVHKTCRQDQVRQQAWVHQVASAICGLSIPLASQSRRNNLRLELTLDDSGSVPPILLANVITNCLSWLTLGQPIEVTVNLVSGRSFQLPPIYQSKDEDDE